MKLEDLIHPEDAKTLKALKNIPALPTIMEKVFQYGYDEISWSENVTSNLRLSKSQMPEIYNRLPPICERLGIPVPELYLQMTPIPNAWTSGHSKPYIVLTLGLIKRVKDEELDAVLAHECGHIVCQHVLYQTLASAIFSLGDSMADSFLGTIGSAALKPVRLALIAWSRASELSADRIACLFVPAQTLAKALARISLIPRYIVDNMDINAWAMQGKDFEDLKDGSAWNKIVRWMANSDADHPYHPVRVYEALEWENTDLYRMLIKSPLIFVSTSSEDILQENDVNKTSEIVNKGRELANRGQEMADKGFDMLKNVKMSSFFKK